MQNTDTLVNIHVLDGAIATQLQARGYSLDKTLWSCKLVMDSPEAVEKLHYDYYSAGADICTSCSYQASFEAFKKLGMDEDTAAAVMQKSVQLVKSAREKYFNNVKSKNTKLVAASISCYGASLDGAQEFSGTYMDSIDTQTIYDFHKKRLECMLVSDPDLILFETVPSLEEARIIVRVLEGITQILPPVLISFSCRNEKSTCKGDPFEECVKLVHDAPLVHGIGINCTAPRNAVSLVDIARSKTSKKIVCYPNNGDIYCSDTMDWKQSDNTIDNMNFYDLAVLLKDKGANIVGGCCRTSPNDISQIAQVMH